MRPLIRRNLETGVVELSDDGGRSWMTAPEPPPGSPGAALGDALRAAVSHSVAETKAPKVRPAISGH